MSTQNHWRLCSASCYLSGGDSGGVDISSETNIVDGEWHHFAVVKVEDDKLHLFIDVVLEASSE